MKSVHTDRSGKYATAVYQCCVRGRVAESLVEQLFPRSWGESVTAMHFTYAAEVDETRWLMLIANNRQTTRSDVVKRIADALSWHPHDDRIDVRVIGAVPKRGSAIRKGTARRGTKRSIANAPYGKGVVAK